MSWNRNNILALLQLIVSITALVLPFIAVPQAISCIAHGGYFSNAGTIEASNDGKIQLNVVGGECKILGTSASSFNQYIIPSMMVIASFGAYLFVYSIKKIKSNIFSKSTALNNGSKNYEDLKGNQT